MFFQSRSFWAVARDLTYYSPRWSKNQRTSSLFTAGSLAESRGAAESRAARCSRLQKHFPWCTMHLAVFGRNTGITSASLHVDGWHWEWNYRNDIQTVDRRENCGELPWLDTECGSVDSGFKAEIFISTSLSLDAMPAAMQRDCSVAQCKFEWTGGLVTKSYRVTG